MLLRRKEIRAWVEKGRVETKHGAFSIVKGLKRLILWIRNRMVILGVLGGDFGREEKGDWTWGRPHAATVYSWLATRVSSSLIARCVE